MIIIKTSSGVSLSHTHTHTHTHTSHHNILDYLFRINYSTLIYIHMRQCLRKFLLVAHYDTTARRAGWVLCTYWQFQYSMHTPKLV